MCGLYQLYRLLQLGVRVTALDLNGDVGGTWFRNRYPGCRFDSESYTYAYSFSEELLNEWDWTERFAPQGETLEYLRYVADKFQLRQHIQFNCKVEAAHFDAEQSMWRVRTQDGREITTRFLMTAMGLLSVPTTPRLPGLERFAGEAIHTFYWPSEGLDVKGKRVGVVGTGSTGVQVISTIAKDVGELTVFQRDPNWCAPLHNAPLAKDEMEEIRRNYDAIFEQCFRSPNGFIHRPLREVSTDVSREERLKLWEELYDQPGFGIWLGNYRDTMMDEEANAELSEFIAGKIRSRVQDPAVAEVLIPKDHGFGTKRVPLETKYYEVYNQPNVRLIDVNVEPITEVTETGVRITTPAGTEDIELDVLVFATGFDAVTGAFDRIDFVGDHGVRLREKWADGPTTYMGVQVTDFPNLLTCVGPQSGSVAANFPRGIEDIVAWMTDFCQYLIDHDIVRVEPTAEAEARWLDHVADINSKVLMSKTRSWFNGHNVNLDRDDRPRHMIYTGGAVRYRGILADEAAAGYPNFAMTSAKELTATPQATSV
ncbi:cyclohexanone monooxygenase [Nocardioides sp. Root1257]|nr:cyclohexanone monooxygenase [Nocardioides sp. Root1257]KRC46075.1 cyclohexanone monooxygenase [Nocardioides sp. Root224]